MTLSIIAAIGANNELGKKNALLWNLPEDMKHFREKTSLHSVIMGRKTFESIGKSLPKRRNIIITKDLNYKKEGAEVVHSIEKALDLFKNSSEEVFIIGGAEVYKKTINFVDKLYLTLVNTIFPSADAFFPEIDFSKWKEVFREDHSADQGSKISYSFVEYIRIK